METSFLTPNKKASRRFGSRLNLDDIPVIGIGICADAVEVPHFCALYANGQPELQQFDYLNVTLSDGRPFAVDLADQIKSVGWKCVAHMIDINLLSPPSPESLQRLHKNVQLVQPVWIEEDLAIWEYKGAKLKTHTMMPIFDDQSLSAAIDAVRLVQTVSNKLMLVENPPVAFAPGSIDLFTFMDTLTRETGCGLVLDIGHLVAYCVATGRDPVRYLASWTGGDRVVEIHIASQHMVRTPMGLHWVDMHSIPTRKTLLKLLHFAFDRTPNVKAITIETEEASFETIQQNVSAVQKVLENSTAKYLLEVSR